MEVGEEEALEDVALVPFASAAFGACAPLCAGLSFIVGVVEVVAFWSMWLVGWSVLLVAVNMFLMCGCGIIFKYFAFWKYEKIIIPNTV